MRGAIHLYIKKPHQSPGGHSRRSNRSPTKTSNRSPFSSPRESPRDKNKRFSALVDFETLVPDLDKISKEDF